MSTTPGIEAAAAARGDAMTDTIESLRAERDEARDQRNVAELRADEQGRRALSSEARAEGLAAATTGLVDQIKALRTSDNTHTYRNGGLDERCGPGACICYAGGVRRAIDAAIERAAALSAPAPELRESDGTLHRATFPNLAAPAPEACPHCGRAKATSLPGGDFDCHAHLSTDFRCVPKAAQTPAPAATPDVRDGTSCHIANCPHCTPTPDVRDAEIERLRDRVTAAEQRVINIEASLPVIRDRIHDLLPTEDSYIHEELTACEKDLDDVLSGADDKRIVDIATALVERDQWQCEAQALARQLESVRTDGVFARNTRDAELAALRERVAAAEKERNVAQATLYGAACPHWAGGYGPNARALPGLVANIERYRRELVAAERKEAAEGALAVLNVRVADAVRRALEGVKADLEGAAQVQTIRGTNAIPTSEVFAILARAAGEPVADTLQAAIAREERGELSPEEAADTERTADAQMREALERIAAQHHTQHCIARQAWGDGECECKPVARPKVLPEIIHPGERLTLAEYKARRGAVTPVEWHLAEVFIPTGAMAGLLNGEPGSVYATAEDATDMAAWRYVPAPVASPLAEAVARVEALDRIEHVVATENGPMGMDVWACADVLAALRGRS